MGTSEGKIVYTVCNSHCGGSCLIKIHVKDGVITRLESDNGAEPQFRACARGRSYRQRVYAPDRLLYPLKRVGDRGAGQFERVSWDEALDTVSSEIKRVRDTYGAASILFFCSVGDGHLLHNVGAMHRLLCMLGGYTVPWGFISFEGGAFSAAATYGTVYGTASTGDDYLNSRMIIMWGWDPATTVQRCNTCWYLVQAREKGVKIVSVDPRHTDSTATFASQWIPIRPGTDAAMLIAMAYVMIKENLQDQEFLDTHTIGFDEFKDYVLGTEDGNEKTPAWAEAITGVPAQTIASLAREYATTKPAALVAGIAPGRTAYGEQYHRAAITLSAMTGNIGVPGGSAADRSWGGESWGGDIAPLTARTKGRMTGPPNQVEADAPPRWNALAGRSRSMNSSARVNVGMFADAILQGKAGGYRADYKLLWLANTNYLNQILEVSKTARALRELEFMVVQEQFMTATAKFADIVLPVCTYMERNDFSYGGATPFYGLVNKAVEPLGESKSHLEICDALAQKLGLTGYNDKSEEEWVRSIAAGFSEAVGIPDYDTLKKQGVHKVKLEQPYIPFKQQIEHPENTPFPTPSGKIEIYSQQIADMAHPQLPPIPKYLETWENANDPLTKEYPLQLITTHFRRRAHSQFETIPWLGEQQRQAVWISTVDAEARGIKDGDSVRVFNDRGQIVLPARVTERMMPGVVNVPEGAWYQPDENGIDRGGCANVLTRNEMSPGGAFPSNTALVQVARA